MTVAACLTSGTRADVAWLVEADGISVPDWSAAVVFTPGGGRVSTLPAGVLVDKLADLVGRISAGRLVDLEITTVDALIAELPSQGWARAIIAPAESLPPEVWEVARARERLCVVADVDGSDVVGTHVYTRDTIAAADPELQKIFAGRAGSTMVDDKVVSVFVAVPQVVVVGSGPVAESVAELAGFMGWEARLVGEASTAGGLIAPLSRLDGVVVAAHDLELAGMALASALESDCGYIGSVGSRKMQADRADWLAYRGTTELTRVKGPAGIDIGAGTPQEIAVSIVAEMIAGAGAA